MATRAEEEPWLGFGPRGGSRRASHEPSDFSLYAGRRSYGECQGRLPKHFCICGVSCYDGVIQPVVREPLMAVDAGIGE